jgi:hypothetical protein
VSQGCLAVFGGRFAYILYPNFGQKLPFIFFSSLIEINGRFLQFNILVAILARKHMAPPMIAPMIAAQTASLINGVFLVLVLLFV